MRRNMSTISLLTTIAFMAICLGVEKLKSYRLETQYKAFGMYHQACVAQMTKKVRALEHDEKCTEEYVLTVFQQIEEESKTEPRCR
jgi:hypothetical protein